MSATNMVAQTGSTSIRKSDAGHFAVIKAAAQDRQVQRIFVNAAIKKALCREAGKDRAFLHKVRPWWGHNYHFHVRIGCPAGSPDCKGQDPAGEGEGCGKDLDYWFSPGAQSAARSRRSRGRRSPWRTSPPHANRCCSRHDECANLSCVSPPQPMG